MKYPSKCVNCLIIILAGAAAGMIYSQNIHYPDSQTSVVILECFLFGLAVVHALTLTEEVFFANNDEKLQKSADIFNAFISWLFLIVTFPFTIVLACEYFSSTIFSFEEDMWDSLALGMYRVALAFAILCCAALCSNGIHYTLRQLDTKI